MPKLGDLIYYTNRFAIAAGPFSKNDIGLIIKCEPPDAFIVFWKNDNSTGMLSQSTIAAGCNEGYLELIPSEDV